MAISRGCNTDLFQLTAFLNKTKGVWNNVPFYGQTIEETNYSAECRDLVNRIEEVMIKEPQIEVSHMYGIKERKNIEINSFVSIIEKIVRDNRINHIIDWCCGFGHLGRLIATKLGINVKGLEIRDDLVEKGQRISKEAQINHSVIKADVMEIDKEIFDGIEMVAALHACGGLTTHLIIQAANLRIPVIAFVSCCYSKNIEGSYKPISQEGKQTGLLLEEHNLLFINLDTDNETGEKMYRKRQLFHRIAQKIDPDYYPRVKRSKLNNIEEYLEHHNLDYTGYDLDKLRDIVEREIKEIDRLDNFRFPFKRVLEWFIALDRIAYIKENGYHVTIHKLCSDKITRRNIMIIGRKIP